MWIRSPRCGMTGEPFSTRSAAGMRKSMSVHSTRMPPIPSSILSSFLPNVAGTSTESVPREYVTVCAAYSRSLPVSHARPSLRTSATAAIPPSRGRLEHHDRALAPHLLLGVEAVVILGPSDRAEVRAGREIGHGLGVG